MKNMNTKINTNSFYKNAVFLGIITLSVFNLSGVHAQSFTNKIEIEGRLRQGEEQRESNENRERGRMMSIEKGKKDIIGIITAINGNFLTVSQIFRSEVKNAPTTTKIYSVDASAAKIIKNGTTSSLSNITIGDKVSIVGTINGTNIVAKIIHENLPEKEKNPNKIIGNDQPVVGGKILSINGNVLTLTNNSNATYTIDVTNAKIFIKGATSSVSSLQINEEIVVQGSVNGTNITATNIIAHQNVKNNGNIPQKNEGFLKRTKNFFKRMFGF